MNNYIKKVEEDTLSSYPLTISKQDYDLSSMMGGQGAADDDTSKTRVRPGRQVPAAKAQEPIRYMVTAVKDMFASVKSNDMTSFKAWLDAGGDGIDKEVNAIQYGYGVTPVVYRAGKGDEKPVPACSQRYDRGHERRRKFGGNGEHGFHGNLGL